MPLGTDWSGGDGGGGGVDEGRSDTEARLRGLLAESYRALAAVRAICNEDTWGEVDPLEHRDRILAALARKAEA